MSTFLRNIRKLPKVYTILTLSLVIIANIGFPGCTHEVSIDSWVSYKTFEGQIDAATCSFQYPSHTRVNPWNPYTDDPSERLLKPEGRVYPDSHINVDVYEINDNLWDKNTSLDNFISTLSQEEDLRDLRFKQKETVTIAGLTAEYMNYYYYGYTTLKVPYEGIIASFTYTNYIINIDVLFPHGYEETLFTFDRIVQTFQILEP